MGEASPANYIAEFVGTFVLIFTVGCVVITGQPVWGGVSIACALTVMIYALGKSSGANFNPAVSVALGLTGAMQWATVGIYCAVQIVAGICASFAYVGMFGADHAFNLAPAKGHAAWQACLVETIYTFMLVFVVLNAAVSKKNGCGSGNQFYGLAIGFVVVAGAYGAGTVSGGCFNPAVAIALDTASFWKGFQWGPIYAVFEIIGAVLAWGLFTVCRPEEKGDRHPAEHPNAGELVADSMLAEDHKYETSSELLSEFLGTYMLVLTVGLNVLGGSSAGAFSIAASLMCMIYALGNVSGAHFNPAVTVAILVRGGGKIEPAKAGMYIGTQIVGGVAAAFTYSAIMNGGTFKLNPGTYAWHQVCMAEFMFTFVLAFVVLSVATSQKPHASHIFGFAIGMCVTVGGVAIGKVSGGSLNPAVSIAISSSHLINGGGGWPCLVYTLVELIAGAFAGVLFGITQPSEYPQKAEADAEAGKAK